MKKVVVTKAGESFKLTEDRTREPAPRSVRVRVEACGVCHSDALTKEGSWPESSIHVRRVTRSPASSMPSAKTLSPGKWAIE
jgi:D-arabinose 1-dehydrogenase-like Zn-dependent alcohol dehydrogenase